jgi:HlyD family secretion protein
VINLWPLLRGRPVSTAGGGVVVLLAGVAAFARPGDVSPDWPTAVATRTAFSERIVERGTVGAARLMLYGSRIPGGPAKITEIVREGTPVSEGDVLLRFDDAMFAQDLARETAARQQALAELELAEEALQLESLQAASEVDRAGQQVGFAETELADETHGAGLVALADLEAAAAEATRETARALTAFEDLKPLLKEGFITAMELELAEQRWRQAIDQEKLTRLRLDTFTKYGRPAAVDKAKATVQSARDDLTRQREASIARLAQRRSSVAAARGRISEIDARIALVRQRLAHTVIQADMAGLVVYRDLFFGGDKRKPQVGDEVWPNQPVIALPDSSQLVIETRVREIDLHRISDGPGRPRSAIVTVDAYPDLRLQGMVSLVGALAEADAARAGVKYFPVTVTLDRGDPRLRTGMTARVAIDVTTLGDAVVIPTQAVFADAESGDRRYCFVVTRGRFDTPTVVRRDVTIVGDDGVQVAVGSGLDSGEVVLLADPVTLGLTAGDTR